MRFGTQALTSMAALILSGSALSGETPPPAPNGIEMPKHYRNWRVIGVSHRTDNDSLRVILGNHIAMQAAEKGQTQPWPDGAILGKVVWKDMTHPFFETATVPGDLSHVEFMIKDGKKFAATGGWGYARWKGEALVPYGENADFAQECANCHEAAKSTDFVFTRPVRMP